VQIDGRKAMDVLGIFRSGINPPPTAAPSDTAVSGEAAAEAGAAGASSADMEGSWNRIVVSYTTLCCKIDVNIL